MHYEVRGGLWSRILLLAVCMVAGVTSTHGQHVHDQGGGLIGLDYDAFTHIDPTHVAGKNAVRSSTIQLTFVGVPAVAQAAFEQSARIWEAHLSSAVPIRVQVRWASLEGNVLASAGPALLGISTGGVVSWYPSALALSLLGSRPDNAPQFDIQMSFNNQINWYYGIDARPPGGAYDLVTVSLHELGHGLGFIGSFRVDDGRTGNIDSCPNVGVGFGCWGLQAQSGQSFPVIFDRFVEDGAGIRLLNTSVYPNPSIQLGSVLRGNEVFFAGQRTIEAYDDVPVNLFAPQSFDRGSSIAHLDEQTFPPGNPNSLMTPFLARAEAIHSPGGIFCGMLEDIGWSIADACEALLQREVFGLNAFLVSSAQGRVRLTWQARPDAPLVRFIIERQYFDDVFVPEEVVLFEPGRAQYSIELSGLPAGRHTFRIRFERADDSESLSAPDAVSIPIDGQLLISGPFPNPVRGSATVHIQTRAAQQFNADLYDAMGRRVLALARNLRVAPDIRGTISIDAGGLAAGVYYLRLYARDLVEVRPLVVVN